MAPNIIKYFFETITLTLTLTLTLNLTLTLTLTLILTLTLTLMECLKFDSFYDTHFKRVILTQILENYLGTGVRFGEGP